MRAVGIIAEFNPIHNGHKYLIDYAKKELGAEQVVVAMSGEFTQRGYPAILDIRDRAQMAVSAGADLVLKMPLAASCGNAEHFAHTGVSLLANTGIVKDILFGCETQCGKLFSDAAQVLAEEPADFIKELLSYVKEGCGYATARSKALISYLTKHFPEYNPVLLAEFLSQPNNNLGIEYEKAALRLGPGITFHPIPRVGAGHRDKALPESEESSADNGKVYSSSSAIREYMRYARHPIYSGFSQAKTSSKNIYGSQITKKLLELMPAAAAATLIECMQSDLVLFPEDFDLLLHEHLIGTDNFENFADSNEDISNKILKSRDGYRSFQSFADSLKSRDIAHTRITRVLAHILLGITKEDSKALEACGFAPYYQIQSFSNKGRELLGELKKQTEIPLFASINEVRNHDGHYNASVSKEAQQILEKDLHGSALYRIVQTRKSGIVLPSEFKRRFAL